MFGPEVHAFRPGFADVDEPAELSGTVFVSAYPLRSLLAALGTFGCGDSTYYHYGYYPWLAASGVTEGAIDTDAILELGPGESVGASVEYFGDGAWRFAVRATPS